MEPLLTSFVAALLAEWGDKTQLLVAALGARYARPLPVIAGVAAAALANSLLAAFGGTLVHGMVTPRAVSLIVGIALTLAGGGALFRSKTPDMGATWRVGPFLTTSCVTLPRVMRCSPVRPWVDITIKLAPVVVAKRFISFAAAPTRTSQVVRIPLFRRRFATELR